MNSLNKNILEIHRCIELFQDIVGWGGGQRILCLFSSFYGILNMKATKIMLDIFY